jgi:MoaA/NifB/PqqE/SkfB family radical SAM enzyme
MTIVVEEFQTWCGFPSMQGTIDYIHVSIVKPQGSYEEDEYYHKTCGYNKVVQAIVDYHKRILVVVVFDFLGSVNDSQILHNLPCKRHNIIDCLILVKVHKMDFHLTSLVTRGIF